LKVISVRLLRRITTNPFKFVVSLARITGRLAAQ